MPEKIVQCDLEGSGNCLGALYLLKGSPKGTARCARHIRLRELWATSGASSLWDFDEWENGASVSTLATAIDINIDGKYWEVSNARED